MDRRRILLIIAAVVAALGTLLVFVYVRSADARAQDSVDSIQVLTANQAIASGESYDTALAAGKITLSGVPKSQLLANVQTSTDALKGTVALQQIFPNEQIVADKFGANVADVSSPLGIPEKEMAISVNLTDPDRVAGFVNPGSEVAIFVSQVNQSDSGGGGGATKLLLPRVTVLGVGSTTPVTTTTTNSDGTQQTEQLPRTLLTLALNQADAQKVILASKTLSVTFALLTKDSTVALGAGTSGTDIAP